MAVVEAVAVVPAVAPAAVLADLPAAPLVAVEEAEELTEIIVESDSDGENDSDYRMGYDSDSDCESGKLLSQLLLHYNVFNGQVLPLQSIMRCTAAHTNCCEHDGILGISHARAQLYIAVC
eukprot:2882-Heterococcus_DN1.PRE.2